MENDDNDYKVVGKVNSVSSSKGSRGNNNGGINIHFASNYPIVADACVQIKYGDTFVTFQVHTVTVRYTDGDFVAIASEYGYRNTLHKTKNFDMRTILESDVTLILSKAHLSNLRKASCMC